MNMREKLKKILIEWSEFKLPQIYARDFNFALLEGQEVLSVIGARRAGKTFLCYQMIQKLRETVPTGNIAYINFEDERLSPFTGEELALLWEIYLEVFTVDPGWRVYLFVDEIQNVKNWSKWVRRITEQNRNIKLIITGSSARLLSQEIATELRGRTLSFVVYPMSFSEYLRAQPFLPEQKINVKILYGKQRAIYKKYFNQYFVEGGFPVAMHNPLRDAILKEYYRTMFYRDLIDRYKIKNIKLFEDYLVLLFDQVGQLFSISATAKKLKELGYSLSKNTLSNFSRYAQSVFLVFEVKKYGYKIKEQLRNPKKIYCIDHALARAVRFVFSQDWGRLLENVVFIELQRRFTDIFYHKGDKECDFIIADKGKVVRAVQVARSIASVETRQREFAGLLEAMRAYGLKEGEIITEDENEEVEIEGKTIRVLPAWYWLLQA